MSRQQDEFRTWAEGLGLLVKKQPEALQGDGDVWGVPLKRGRGWIWDAGPGMIGVDYRASQRAVSLMASRLRQKEGFRLQTHAIDAVVGRMPKPTNPLFLLEVLGARAKRALSLETKAAMAVRLKALRSDR